MITGWFLGWQSDSKYLKRLRKIGKVEAQNRTAIKDMLGRTVIVPAQVKRVVGIEAGALRLLVYLKAAHLVVGVEDTEQKELTKPYLMARPELDK